VIRIRAKCRSIVWRSKDTEEPHFPSSKGMEGGGGMTTDTDYVLEEFPNSQMIPAANRATFVVRAVER